MTVTENIHSRFKVTSTPTELPGSCAVCGSTRSDDRVYVEWGLKQLVPSNSTDPFSPPKVWGRIYFCSFCLTEAASALGMGTRSQVDMDEVIRQREILEERVKYVDTYRDVFEQHLTDLRALLSDSSSVPAERAEQSNQVSDGGFGEGDRLTSVERPDDLSGDSGNRDFVL